MVPQENARLRAKVIGRVAGILDTMNSKIQLVAGSRNFQWESKIEPIVIEVDFY
jgi:hypothetical protein